MTPEEVRSTETAILDVCLATVAAVTPKLAERGMECTRLEVAVHNSDPDRYCSEVRADILRDGQLVGVLEFFVYDDGHLVITPEAAERYTREVLLEEMCR